MLSVTFNFNSAEAKLQTWIVDDGGTGNFSKIQDAINAAGQGDTIYVRSGTYNESLVVSKTLALIGENVNNTIIDAAGKGSPVYMTADDISISGFTIRNGAIAIYIENSENNHIHGNLLTNANMGIVLSNSHANTIENNILVDNFGNGIELQRSNHNIIRRNNVRKNPAYGIYLSRSENNTIIENIVADICDGISLEYSTNNKIIRNIVANNSPVGLLLNHADSNLVEDNDIIENNFGIHLLASEKNILNQNNMTANSYGLYLQDSGNNTLQGSIMTRNMYNFGVSGSNLSHFVNRMDSSNTVDEKPVYYWVNQRDRSVPPDAGYVALVNSTNIVAKDLYLTKNMQGVLIAYSNNISIQNVTVTNTFSGGISMWQSKNNTIKKNTIAQNLVGVFVRNSTANVFYHNNFIDNTKQIESDGTSTNVWDHGYPSGGNYWTDYAGEDKKSGFSQDIAGADGKGDTAFVINSNNRDRYPLMGRITVFNAGTWNNVDYEVDVVSNSTVSDFYFNPNAGAFIRFNLTSSNERIGFARVIIPKQLLWVDNQTQWVVLVGNQQISPTVTEDDEYTYLYFTYEHSTKTILIQGTGVIQPKEESGQVTNTFTYVVTAILVIIVLGSSALLLLRRKVKI